MEAPRTEPRLITRVVCGYRVGFLPGDWLQTRRRLDRLFARANLNVKATLKAEKIDPQTEAGPKIVSYTGYVRND